MKTTTILLFMLVSQIAYSQSDAPKMEKAEKKKLVAQAKKFKSKPQLLKNLLNEFDAVKRDVAESNVLLAEAQNKIVALEMKVEKLEVTNERLGNTVANNQEKLTQSKRDAVTKGYQLPKEGTVFRVQIGGYKKRDMSAYIDNSTEGLQLETNNADIQEITVGQFTDYYKANDLKKHLRAMGVKDAWIVPYKNGKRVLLKEVINEIE